jgi:hypothetical protein
MPRYFFHLCEDDRIDDEEGRVLSGADEARKIAVDCARDIVCADVMQGHLDLNHSIAVVGESGEHVLTMTFREAIQIRN